MSEHHSVIIIGAGLSGLYAAWRLHRQQLDVLVLEARDRIGGRILSASPDEGSGSVIDLGPAWCWPALQPRLQGLMAELDVPLFRQFTDGDMLYELDAQNIQLHGGPSSHNQSYRVAGGSSALIEALQAHLATESIHLNTQVSAIQRAPLCITAIRAGEAVEYSADHVILALPPRLALSSIEFRPGPDEAMAKAWQNTPTWMAGHSKMVFIYDEAFWRKQGLSGEVLSRHGPLSEIYDGSSADETFYALTSFVGLNAAQRQQLSSEQLNDACMVQLTRLFGQDSRKVRQILVSDWSKEVYTTTEWDLNSMAHHPQYPVTMPRSLWDQRLLLAGTEVAREYGGYLEGAIESADEVLSIISR